MKKVKKIYIILSYTGTYFSNFLKFILKEKYVHVSIGIDNLDNIYSFGRKKPNRMFPCGFVKEDLKSISSTFENSICQVYELKIKQREYRLLLKAIDKFKRRRKYLHYNIKGLVHIKFNKVYHRENHYVCSQFVGKILQESKIYDFKKDYSLIKPNDVLSIKKLNLIYEGTITNCLDKLKNSNIKFT